MTAQLLAQSPCRRHSGQDPERVAEHLAELVVGVGVEIALLAHQAEETVNVAVVAEGAVVACAEELTEVECLLVVAVFRAEKRSEIVGVDVDGWQRLVGVRVAHVCEIPFRLGTLLHHIVPCEDFLLFVVVEQVERRSRQS